MNSTKSEKSHHLVDFASRYSDFAFPSFDAASALWRVEALLDDARQLIDLRTRAELAQVFFGSRNNTYEIISYYSIGFVTCLEWHARSRLVDLFIHRPELIETQDIGRLDKRAITQMISKNVTVPYLLGASTSISSVESYLAVFDRLYRGLNAAVEPKNILKNVQAPDHSPHEWLQMLFDYRHHLVHEIDLAIIGHFSLRDMWTPETVVQFGTIVRSTILELERHLSNVAPANFPNRLGPDGYPEDPKAKIEKEIADLEDELSKSFSDDDWKAAIQATREAIAKESAFIENCVQLCPVRHLDKRGAVTLEFLKMRVAYLKMLKEEMF